MNTKSIKSNESRVSSLMEFFIHKAEAREIILVDDFHILFGSGRDNSFLLSKIFVKVCDVTFVCLEESRTNPKRKKMETCTYNFGLKGRLNLSGL
eukprot:m.41367 g.41367  ORF g.41367 m.41367 type:complete len:95 (+) comp33145_c0_seq2:790-1074(+)